MANGTQMATAFVMPPMDAPHGCGGRRRHEFCWLDATAIERTPRRDGGDGDRTTAGAASPKLGLSGPSGSPILSVTDAESVGTSLWSSATPSASAAPWGPGLLAAGSSWIK